MNYPNQFHQSDTLEAREIVKTWLPPSFVKDIDAGLLDPFGLMERARAIIITRRKAEEQEAV